MLEAFSFNREYDFIRLDGLSRATGRPAHEWDMYILKELIDNALDADESLWCKDPEQSPSLHIKIAYIKLPDRQQLLVQVENRATFPVEHIEAIFDTRSYTSRNALVKRLTRGALGNALKTLLGIPYALHKRSADTDEEGLQLKPLSIICNETEFLPRYIIDSTAQSIRFTCEKEHCDAVEGTVIRIGLDYFVQEIPRTLTELQLLAQQYHLCNPHVHFIWEVEIDDNQELWKEIYEARPGWINKFRETAPVQWYSVIAFKELLGALYREQGESNEGSDHVLPIKTICQYFPRLHNEALGQNQDITKMASIIRNLKRDSLTRDDINGQPARELYAVLSRYSHRFDTFQLGYVGVEHIRDVLTSILPLESEVQYDVINDAGKDINTDTPFVIEVAAARLREGKRQIWTAINFSPTYSDPFQSRWLHTNLLPDDPVLGLRNLMDVYGYREEEPIVLFLHLICPTIEHTEFSKTEINHLPFEKVLNGVLDKVLTELRQAHEEKELRLEQAVFQALHAILETLEENERFVFEQLEERLILLLRQDTELSSWLERPDSIGRLRAYITNFQIDNPNMNKYVARQTEAMIYLPSHPEQYILVPIEQNLCDRLAQNYVNKIVYVQSQELETVFLANKWLCQMDMALLRAPFEIDALKDALLSCINQCELPILVLHNGDEEGYGLVEQMRTWLKDESFDTERIVDLRDRKGNEPHDTIQTTRLMPRELAHWLLKCFDAVGISVKFTPSTSQIRQDIRDQFERILQGALLEDIGEKFKLLRLIMDVDTSLSFTRMMIDEALDEQLKKSLKQNACAMSYAMLLDTIVETFFEKFMILNGTKVWKMEQVWLAHRQNEFQQDEE